MRTGNMGLFIGGVEMSEAFIDLKCNKSCRHIRELEQQKAELIEFIKFMNEYGKLSPELLATKTDIIYHDSSDLLKKHGVEI